MNKVTDNSSKPKVQLHRRGVWSIWVRLRTHLPRNKDSVTGELLALQSQPSLARNQRGILSSVTSHCCEAGTPHESGVTCQQAAETKNILCYLHSSNTRKRRQENLPKDKKETPFNERHTWLHCMHFRTLSHIFFNNHWILEAFCHAIRHQVNVNINKADSITVVSLICLWKMKPITCFCKNAKKQLLLSALVSPKLMRERQDERSFGKVSREWFVRGNYCK